VADGDRTGDGDPSGPGRRLVGRQVVLRAPVATDVAPLTMIQAEPDVARWWPPDPGGMHDLLLAPDADVTPWVIEHEGRVVGFIQDWEEADPEFRHAGIDLFLAGAVQGRGLGPEAIRVLATYLFEARGHHRLTIDPAAANERAIRAYAKVGFRTVGRLRAYQRLPDGTWVDGLLMELLVGELLEAAATPAGD
jgi:aminoglycoside 6'-N-acetyltransferase